MFFALGDGLGQREAAGERGGLVFVEGLQADLAFGGVGGDLGGGFRALAVEDDDLFTGREAQDVERVVGLRFVEAEGVGIPGGGRDVEAMHGRN